MNNMENALNYYHPDRKIPWALRRLGCFDLERNGARFRWGDIYWGLRFGFALYSFEEGYSLHIAPGFGYAFIKLPRWLPHKEPREILDAWGFEISREHMLYLKWGERTKMVSWPFTTQHVRMEILRKDGTWGEKSWKRDEAGEHIDGRATEKRPYRYLTSGGEKQEVEATISVIRHIRRRRFLPFWQWVETSIDVQFSGEVGDRAGSWKGGCIGCGYEMKRGESPAQTLRRMEQERKFK